MAGTPTSTSGRNDSSGPELAGRQHQPRIIKILSGSLSGMAVSVALQPLDVLRTTMQTDAAKSNAARQQVMTTMRSVMDEGGVAAMWRGSSATVIRLGLGAGFHFMFIDIAKSILERPQPDGRMGMTPIEAALTGGVARALSAAALSPVTLVKTRLEYGKGAQMYTNGAFGALRSIYKSEGARGLFRGLGPTVLTNAPFSGLYYMFYSGLQRELTTEGRNQMLVNFSAGTLAAGGATLLTQPADVLRTRSQMGLMRDGAGILESLRHVVATQGPRALMTGTSPKIVKKILQTALVWTLYEELVPRLSKAAARYRDDGGKEA